MVASIQIYRLQNVSTHLLCPDRWRQAEQRKEKQIFVFCFFFSFAFARAKSMRIFMETNVPRNEILLTVQKINGRWNAKRTFHGRSPLIIIIYLLRMHRVHIFTCWFSSMTEKNPVFFCFSFSIACTSSSEKKRYDTVVAWIHINIS